MIQESETKQQLGPGVYTTRDGCTAVVDAVVDGVLVGRVNIAKADSEPAWYGIVWGSDGRKSRYLESQDDIGVEVRIPVRQEYWLNIYDDGPGLLRNSWEQALIEASQQDKQPLCRVKIPIKSFVGEGLK